MERIGGERERVGLETRTDELERREASEGLEAFGEVVGVEKGGEMFVELRGRVVMVGTDSGVFESAVHAFDLTIGPRMIGFGEAVIDEETSAGKLEGMSAEEFTALESGTDV